MRKVLTERSRYGTRVKDPKGYRKQLQRDLAGAQDFVLEHVVDGVIFVYEHEAETDPPRWESMRKKWKARFCHKTLNDHAAPLGKLLIKNAGRAWDQVWSEVCEHADERSVSGHHLREHVWRYVEHHAWKEEDGRVCVLRRYSYSFPTELRPGSFYVCPETRLLKVYKPTAPQPPLPWKRQPEPPQRVQAGPLRQYQLVNNCWFELHLAEVSTSDLAGPRDAFLRKQLVVGSGYSPDRSLLIETYGYVENGNKLVYCTKKRQLSKSEIRKAGLKKQSAH